MMGLIFYYHHWISIELGYDVSVISNAVVIALTGLVVLLSFLIK